MTAVLLLTVLTVLTVLVVLIHSLSRVTVDANSAGDVETRGCAVTDRRQMLVVVGSALASVNHVHTLAVSHWGGLIVRAVAHIVFGHQVVGRRRSALATVFVTAGVQEETHEEHCEDLESCLFIQALFFHTEHPRATIVPKL